MGDFYKNKSRAKMSRCTLYGYTDNIDLHISNWFEGLVEYVGNGNRE